MIEDLNRDEDQEELLILLLALARRSEDRILRITEPALLRALVRVRRIIEEMKFDGMSRQVEYQTLKERIINELIPYNTALSETMPAELQSLLDDANSQLSKVFDVPKAQLRSRADLLGTILVGSYILRDTIGPPGRLGRQTIQVLRDLEAKVKKGILEGKPTEDIAKDIVDIRRGKPVTKGGTTASKSTNLLKNTVKAAAWQAVRAANEDTVAKNIPPGVPWVWNAILDPKTCPICRPLHGMTKPNKDAFPYPYKASEIVHPRCRCLILPKIRLR